jgi:hypothetical protein
MGSVMAIHRWRARSDDGHAALLAEVGRCQRQRPNVFQWVTSGGPDADGWWWEIQQYPSRAVHDAFVAAVATDHPALAAAWAALEKALVPESCVSVWLPLSLIHI